MQTIELSIYKFDELSAEAQERAIERWRVSDDMGHAWAGEVKDTLDAFVAFIGGITVKSWQYDQTTGFVDFGFDDTNLAELEGVRLWKWITNNLDGIKGNGVMKEYEILKQYDHCPLTGVCFDVDILKPLHDFMARPDKGTTFEELLGECFGKWVNTCVADYDAQSSDEYIKDIIQANEYDFEEDGERYH